MEGPPERAWNRERAFRFSFRVWQQATRRASSFPFPSGGCLFSHEGAENRTTTPMANKFSKAKKVVVLAGPPESGKTTTLNYLASAIASHFNVSSSSIDQPKPHPFDANGKSIDGQFSFKIPVRGTTVVVGISTAGDDTDAIISGFGFFDENNCETCFISSRTWGAVFNKVKEEAQTRLAICQRVRMKNSINSSDRAVEEQKTAELLFSII